MAWTQTDVDALKKAIALGQDSFTTTYSDGRSITRRFRSQADMLSLLAVMEAEVSPSTLAVPPRTVAAFASGLQGSTLRVGRRCWR